MVINALIAGGIAPVQTTSIADREAKRAMTDGQLRMNALNDDKLRENAYAIQQRNALNEAYAAENAQPGSGAALLAARGQGSAIPEMNKTRTAQEAAELTNKTNSTKLYVDRMKAANDELRFVKDVTGLEAWAAKMQSDPVIAQNSNPQATAAFMQQIQAAKQNPALFQQLFQQVALGADEFTKRTTQTLDQVEADKFQREQLASGDARAKAQLGLGYAQLAQQKEEAAARLAATQNKPGKSTLTPEQEGMKDYMEAQGRVLGKNAAEAQIKLPKTISAAETALTNIDNMIGDANLDKDGNIVIPKGGRNTAPGFESYVGATLLPGLSKIEGSDTAGFKARLDQVKGQAFLEAFESLKGGGSITVTEGEKATSAITRMNKAASEKEFIQAARELQQIIRTGVQRAKQGSRGIAPTLPGQSSSNSDEDLLRKYGGL